MVCFAGADENLQWVFFVPLGVMDLSQIRAIGICHGVYTSWRVSVLNTFPREEFYCRHLS